MAALKLPLTSMLLVGIKREAEQKVLVNGLKKAFSLLVINEKHEL